MRLVAVFLSFLAAMFAADRRDIAETTKPMARASAQAMWSATGIDNMAFPQAPGAIAVRRSDANTNAIFTAASLPSGTCIVGQIIAPDGNGAINTDTFCVAGYTGPFSFEIWNGPFPLMWPAGPTRLRVLVNSNGNVTEANAYVPVRSCCINSGPQVSVAMTPDNQGLMVTGNFRNPVFAINGTIVLGVNISPTNLTPFGQTQGSATVPIPLWDSTLSNEGNGILTVCEGGWCSQTFFHVVQSQSVAPTNGGKG